MPAANLAPSAPGTLLDIRLDTVSKAFHGPGGALPVVDRVTLHVPGGSTTALVGPSGCGKSTVLRLVAGLDEADEGKVTIEGAVPTLRRAEKALSVAFQDDALLPWRTLEGNIALARRLAKMPPAPELVASLIDRVGLAGFEKKRPAELSGGMRQRAAIARSLATSPRVLLLDEPFGALDALTRRRLNIELPPVWGEGQTTVLVVTHSVAEAALLADRIVVLSPRPARTVATIEVPLPRPRRAEMIHQPAFIEAVRATEHALAQADHNAAGADA